MDAPLISANDANEFGFTPSLEAIRRASARIRGHLSQLVTAGTSTIDARGPVFRLPQRPVVAVSSVVDTDGLAVSWNLSGSLLTVDSLDLVTVTYSHGYTTLPDALVELVCQVATRLDTPTPELAAGVQTQGVGPYSVGYGWDSYKAQAGLTQGEKDALRQYWPPLPNVITMGRPA